jgi:hypothetical protein
MLSFFNWLAPRSFMPWKTSSFIFFNLKKMIKILQSKKFDV